MNSSLRFRFGQWVARYKWTHQFIREYSHKHGGKDIYLNRINRAFL